MANMDSDLDLLLFEELIAEVVAALDGGTMNDPAYAAAITKAVEQGNVAQLQVAFARFTHYQYTTAFLETKLTQWAWAPHLTRLVDATGTGDQNTIADAIETMHAEVSNDDMWLLTGYLCHLGQDIFNFTGGHTAFLRSCRLHGQAAVDPARQGPLIEPAAILTAMYANGRDRAAAELLQRYLPQWDFAALFTLWLAVTAKLAPAGPLGMLALSPDGIPSGFTRSDSLASDENDESDTSFARLLIDAVTATRDRDLTTLTGLTAQVRALDLVERYDLLIQLGHLTGSAFAQTRPAGH